MRQRSALTNSLLIAALACTGGCDPTLPGLSSLGGTPVAGGSFESAARLRLDENGGIMLRGDIFGTEVDVYDLGPVQAGDHITVLVEATAGSTLDPTTALFDTDGHLMTLNDDADLFAGRLESSIDYVVRTDTPNCFVATGRSYFTPDSGAYQAFITIDRGGTLPQPQHQTLVLHFGGGAVSIPNVGDRTLSPFDAADVDAAYAGMTDQIKAGIIATVRENFVGTHLTVVTSDDPTQPAPGTFSTLYFGGFSRSAFGMSQSVDHENMNICDDGIVFTDRFAEPFASTPTPTGIAIAIANVAAHEAGHLLGLEHVADITALMDTTGTASTLLQDQNFLSTRLDISVFRIGDQDAPALLDLVLPP